MKNFARIDGGLVAEIIPPISYEIDSPVGAEPTFQSGNAVPIELRFHSDILATLVEIPENVAVSVGYVYENGVFAPYVAAPLSPAQICATNISLRDALIAEATLRIAPLQDAVDLGEVTAVESAALTAWKRYRIEVNRIDLTKPYPDWPVSPA